MRLGARKTILHMVNDTISMSARLYQQEESVDERHRHRCSEADFGLGSQIWGGRAYKFTNMSSQATSERAVQKGEALQPVGGEWGINHRHQVNWQGGEGRGHSSQSRRKGSISTGSRGGKLDTSFAREPSALGWEFFDTGQNLLTLAHPHLHTFTVPLSSLFRLTLTLSLFQLFLVFLKGYLPWPSKCMHSHFDLHAHSLTLTLPPPLPHTPPPPPLPQI